MLPLTYALFYFPLSLQVFWLPVDTKLLFFLVHCPKWQSRNLEALM